MTFSVDLNGKRTLPLAAVESITIAPMHGWAGHVKAGQYLKLTDPRGRQCGDLDRKSTRLNSSH